MPQLNREDFMTRIKAIVGEADDDESLSFIADMTDTFDAMSQPSDLQAELDAEKKAHADLRKKYKERFFSGAPADKPNKQPSDETHPHGAEEITFDDLFKDN